MTRTRRRPRLDKGRTMKLSVSHFDEEIRELENRIALERLALEDAVTGATDALRYTASKTVSSPKTLLALAGVGFVLGKFMFGKKAPPQHVIIPQKTGVLGLLTGLAGTAVSLMQPGLTGAIARWAATKAFGDKPAVVKTPGPVTRGPVVQQPRSVPRAARTEIVS